MCAARCSTSRPGNAARQRGRPVHFEQYCTRYRAAGFDIPALSQVCLHYDPYIRRAGGIFTCQLMDFLLPAAAASSSSMASSTTPTATAALTLRDTWKWLPPTENCGSQGTRSTGFGGLEIADMDKAADLMAALFDWLLGSTFGQAI
jgi:hypothetical protein